MPRGRDPEPGPLSHALARILSDEVAAQVLTHAMVGMLVGMSKSQVGRSLRAERIMDVEQVDRMCRALGLDFIEVVSRATAMRDLS